MRSMYVGRHAAFVKIYNKWYPFRNQKRLFGLLISDLNFEIESVEQCSLLYSHSIYRDRLLYMANYMFEFRTNEELDFK